MTARARPRLPRPVWIAATILGAYLTVELLFAHEASVKGLLSPSGTPHVGVLAIGAVFLALRVVVRFVVPAMFVYLLVARTLRRWGRGPPHSSAGGEGSFQRARA
jgi:hypothetical protein